MADSKGGAKKDEGGKGANWRKIVNASLSALNPVVRKKIAAAIASVSDDSPFRGEFVESLIGVLSSFVEATSEAVPGGMGGVLEKVSDYLEYAGAELGSGKKAEKPTEAKLAGDWLSAFLKHSFAELGKCKSEKELQETTRRLKAELTQRLLVIDMVDQVTKSPQPKPVSLEPIITKSVSWKIKWEEASKKADAVLRDLGKKFDRVLASPLRSVNDRLEARWSCAKPGHTVHPAEAVAIILAAATIIGVYIYHVL